VSNSSEEIAVPAEKNRGETATLEVCPIGLSGQYCVIINNREEENRSASESYLQKVKSAFLKGQQQQHYSTQHGGEEGYEGI
jgi:hypothetical protein